MKIKEIIKNNKLKAAILLICVSFYGFAFAQQSPENDPLAIYSPEFVMKHQQSIGLTDEQKKVIKNEIQSKSARFNELQWEMLEAGEAFQKLLGENQVDEKKANDQLDKILNIEREVKRLQINLIIRIKNLLTLEQKAKLEALRNRK